MPVQRILPAAPLRPFIDNFFDLWLPPGSAAPVCDHVLPQIPTLYLMVKGEGTAASKTQGTVPLSPLSIAGPLTDPVAVSLTVPLRIVGMGLRPAGWDALLSPPPVDLLNRVVPLASVATVDFKPVLADMAATTFGAAFDRLQHHVRGMLAAVDARPDDRSVAVRELVDRGEVRSTEALSARLNLSRRQTVRYVKDRFGVEPKLMIRIARFQRTVARMMAEGSSGASGLVYSEYADHAHFTRDFRRFANTTPARYFAAPHPLWQDVWISKTPFMAPDEVAE